MTRKIQHVCLSSHQKSIVISLEHLKINKKDAMMSFDFRKADVFVLSDVLLFFFRQYGGFSTDETKRVELEELINNLNAANKQYRDDVFYTAGYEGPYAFVRHNEIWAVSV